MNSEVIRAAARMIREYPSTWDQAYWIQEDDGSGRHQMTRSEPDPYSCGTRFCIAGHIAYQAILAEAPEAIGDTHVERIAMNIVEIVYIPTMFDADTFKAADGWTADLAARFLELVADGKIDPDSEIPNYRPDTAPRSLGLVHRPGTEVSS